MLTYLLRSLKLWQKVKYYSNLGSKMPCFPPHTDINKILTSFRDRFYANKSETEFNKILNDLVNNSYNNWRIIQYDKFQKITNDIRP